VAHDVFHHSPDDTGTYVEEVATFGAQTLFEMPPGQERAFQNTLATSWFSVMALVLENGTRGVAGLIIDHAPGPQKEHALTELWKASYRAAIIELRDVFGEWAEDDTWDALSGEQMENNAAAWAAHGFEKSQQRWPNIEQARKDFWKVEAMAREIKPDHRLSIVEQEDGSIRSSYHSRIPSHTMRMR
jgi:hypothetical protein